jgi:hypothetical protein
VLKSSGEEPAGGRQVRFSDTSTSMTCWPRGSIRVGTGSVTAGGGDGTVNLSGQWRDMYRTIEQFGRVIDAYFPQRQDTAATRCFFTRALNTSKVTPGAVITDKAAVYPRVLDELAPGASHHAEKYANKPDRGRS